MDRKEAYILKYNNNMLLNQPSPLLSIMFIRVSITSIEYDEPTPMCYGSFRGRGFASGDYYNRDLCIYMPLLFLFYVVKCTNAFRE